MELWPFIPQQGFTESLEWLTDVQRAKGAEQRISLRPQARQGHAFQYLLDEQQLARAKSLARFCSGQELLVPGWESLTRVGSVASGATSLALDTTNSPYRVGDQIIVLEEDDVWETRTLDGVSAGGLSFADPLARSYSHAMVMPLRTSRFAQAFEATRGTSPLSKCQARFVSTQVYSLEDEGLAPAYPTYLGHDVLTDRTVLVSDVNERFVRETDSADSGLGVLWEDPAYKYPVQTSSISWSLDDPQTLLHVRAWLDERRGRWRGFWMPSWNVDLVLAAPAVSSDTTLTVRNVGYHLYETVRDIMILTTAGAMHFCRILHGTAGFLGVETLTLDGALGLNLDPSQVQAICLLTFTRLDADRVEIKHRAGRGADIMIPVMEAPIP